MTDMVIAAAAMKAHTLEKKRSALRRMAGNIAAGLLGQIEEINGEIAVTNNIRDDVAVISVDIAERIYVLVEERTVES